ncbi:MAG: hypothetical protein M3Y87_37470 [Myxococcota bacterium]|nr:hypothetical protein [Myxococcota bacterium]
MTRIFLPSIGLCALLLSGCFASSEILSTPDARVTSDAGNDGGPDAGLIVAGTIDAGTIDASVPPPSPLRRALTCDLDDAAVLRAAARFTSCDERATMRQVVEMWEAGLFSGIDLSGGLVGPGLDDLGCEVWRCIAGAGDCAAMTACLEGASSEPAGGCPAFTQVCDGTSIALCDDAGRAHRRLDCAALGATCEEGRCRLGDCQFGAEFYQLDCVDGDLAVCGGAIRASCGAWIAGSRCASFAIGGEVPTAYCSPTGGGVAGAYPTPVSCASGIVTFESSATGRTFRFECAASGYAGCDERGCVLP